VDKSLYLFCRSLFGGRLGEGGACALFVFCVCGGGVANSL
jgi:hypothetical protein